MLPSNSSFLLDREAIERYTDQPAVLPAPLRALIERELSEPIELYALIDLDAKLEFVHSWLVLTRTWITHVLPSGELRSWRREELAAVRLDTGLSCNVLRLLPAGTAPARMVHRFSHRQRRSVDHVAFVLEQQLEGRHVELGDADQMYAESLMRPIRDAQALFSTQKLSVLWRLLGYLDPYRRQLAIGMGAAFLITLASLLPPLLSGYLIDQVIDPVQNGQLTRARAFTAAWLAVGAMAIAYALRQLCAFVRLRLMAILGELVARDLRTDLYRHLQDLSMAFFTRMKTGSLITRVSSDTDRLWEFLALGVVDVSLSVVMLLGLSGVLLYLDWRLGIVMILPVPFVCCAIFAHGKRMERVFLRAWRKWSRVTDIVSDTIPGMRVVKAFDASDREEARFAERNYGATDEFNDVHRIWTRFWPVAMGLVHFTMIGVWMFALPRLLQDGSVLGPPLSAGVFVSFLLYATMFVHPIEIVGQMTRVMNRATSSAHRVFEVLDSRPDVVDRPDPVRLRVCGELEFDDVSFSYDGTRQILRGVSFKVGVGEMIGLVGPSGGGKTTLIALLARFYDVTGGAIRVDGTDLRELASGHFRSQIGMVLQDPYLFQGSVLENIRYGRPDAAHDEVVEAARAANAHDFVCAMRYGYDTIVGERGQTLSGGERQRISIARAVLANPRILILDEATSAVDTETEHNIQEALDRLVTGRTVIAIAHRLSTLRRADRLLVVKDGRIVECGSHAELLAVDGGVYRHLHELQHQLHLGA